MVKELPGFGVAEKSEEWLRGDSGDCRFFVDDSEMMAALGQAALFCRGVEVKQSIERKRDVGTMTEIEGFGGGWYGQELQALEEFDAGERMEK